VSSTKKLSRKWRKPCTDTSNYGSVLALFLSILKETGWDGTDCT